MLVGVGGTTAIEVNAMRCQLDSITKRGKNRQSRLDRVAVSIVAKNKSRDRRSDSRSRYTTVLFRS